MRSCCTRGARLPASKRLVITRSNSATSASQWRSRHARCLTIADIALAGKVWGLAAQDYGLRSAGDCGIGDAGRRDRTCRKGCRARRRRLALSPVHALFAADPRHFSPYSPSSRLFYNPFTPTHASCFGELASRAMSKPSLGERANELGATDADRLAAVRATPKCRSSVACSRIYRRHDLAAVRRQPVSRRTLTNFARPAGSCSRLTRDFESTACDQAVRRMRRPGTGRLARAMAQSGKHGE